MPSDKSNQSTQDRAQQDIGMVTIDTLRILQMNKHSKGF
jgi:hypothetical protein